MFDRKQSAPSIVRAPQSWFGSAAEASFRERLRRATRRILLLDYDGTIAPFNSDKMKAVPYPDVAAAIRRLHTDPRVRLAFVTGRRAGALELLFDVAREIEVWGSHGREYIARDRTHTIDAASPEQLATLARIRADIEGALESVPLGLEHAGHRSAPHTFPEIVELKPASLAVHWRALDGPSQNRVHEAADAAYERHATREIDRLPFECGMEFRAAGRTKAAAVRHVLAQMDDDDVMAYLGDDLTDEDAFAAVPQHGLALLVRPEVRPSLAPYWLRPPEEVARFLNAWAAPSDDLP